MSHPPLSPASAERTTADRAAQALRRGRELHASGEYAQAAACFREAVSLREAAFGPDDPRTLDAVRHEAAALAALGELSRAADLQARALVGAREAAARARARLADDASALARLRGRQEAWSDAAELWLLVLRERRAVFGPQDPGTLAALAQLATALQSAGRFRLAERAWRRLLAAREAAGAPPAELAAVRDRIADCLAAQEQRGEALALRLRALSERSTPPPADAPSVVSPHPDDPPLEKPASAAVATPIALPAVAPDEATAGRVARGAWLSTLLVTRTRSARRLLLAGVLLVVAFGALAIVNYERERARREAELDAARRQELAPPPEETAPPTLGAPSTEVYRPR